MIDIKKLVKEVLSEGVKLPEILNILFVSQKKIVELNNKYRNVQGATDVLSFNIDNVCEIYICPAYLMEQKRFYEEELIRMMVHGIIHITGGEHTGHFNQFITSPDNADTKIIISNNQLTFHCLHDNIDKTLFIFSECKEIEVMQDQKEFTDYECECMAGESIDVKTLSETQFFNLQEKIVAKILQK